MSQVRMGNLLFQFVMRHSYFRDGLAKGIDALPTPSGASQISRFGGKYVADEGGGFVLYPTRQGLAASPPAVQFPANITLGLRVSDTQFGIYTAMEPLPRGMAWYCNNLMATDAATMSMQALQVRPSQFSLDFSTEAWPVVPGAQRRLRIARLNGELVVDKTYFTTPKNQGCPVDLRLYSDGAYLLEFWVEGASGPYAATFYKAEGGMVMGQFGYFEWFATQGSAEMYSSPPMDLMPPGAPSPLGQQLRVQFHARETVWEYFLVSKSGHKVRNPRIEPVVVGRHKVSFTQTGSMIPLPNGSFATQLTASAAIALKESPHLDIVLEAQDLPKGMRLPYAAPNVLYETERGGQPSSRIYVYF